MTDRHMWWYLARASGMTTLALLAASTVWGLLMSTRALQARGLPRWLADLHRFLGGLTLAFCAVHLGALALDATVSFGPAELLVPFASAWRPAAVAWGILALYLLAAIEVTSLAMGRIPRRIWTVAHRSSFVALWAGAVHAATAGSDVSNPAYRIATVVVVLLIAALVLFRVLVGRRARTQRRRTGPGRDDGRGIPGRRDDQLVDA